MSEPTPTPVVVATPAVVSASPSPSMSHEDQMLALIPEDAKGDGLLAAEAMAKFFISLVPELYRTDDTALWEFLSLPSCEFCASGLANSRAYMESGKTFEGGEFVLPEIILGSVLDVDGTELAYVPVPVQEKASVTYGPNGEIESTGSAREVEFTVALELVGGQWRINGIAFDMD